MEPYICEKCGNEFRRYPAKGRRHRFCSRKCSGLVKQELPKCLFCESFCNRPTTKFCSKKCEGAYRSFHNISRGGPPLSVLPRDCLTCGKTFAPVGYTKAQKYCSRHCMGLARADFCSELGKSHAGLTRSLEARKNMSRAQASRNADLSYTKGIGGIREDIGHYVRSSWEANIARLLKWFGIPYEFEPDVIELLTLEGESLFYKPDFKTEYGYIEVKGWWTAKSIVVKTLLRDRSEIEIVYIDEIVYKELQKMYKDIVPNWEFDKRRS